MADQIPDEKVETSTIAAPNDATQQKPQDPTNDKKPVEPLTAGRQLLLVSS